MDLMDQCVANLFFLTLMVKKKKIIDNSKEESNKTKNKDFFELSMVVYRGYFCCYCVLRSLYFLKDLPFVCNLSLCSARGKVLKISHRLSLPVR